MAILMKITTLLFVLTLSQNLMAGIEKFNSDEFNAIINENLQAEKALQEQLQVNAGVPDMQKELNPNFAEKGRQLVGVVEAENVAVPTTDHKREANSNPLGSTLIENNLKRVSQEIESLDGE